MEFDEDEPLPWAAIEELEHKICHVCRVLVRRYDPEKHEHEEEHQKNLKNLIEPTREEWLAFILRESGDCYYPDSKDDDDDDDDGELIEVYKEEGTCIPTESIKGEEKTTTKPESTTLITLTAADNKESKTSVGGDEEDTKESKTSVGGDEEDAKESKSSVGGDEEDAKESKTSVGGDEEDAKESEVEVGENSQGTKQHHKKLRLDYSGTDVRSFEVEDSDFVAKGEERVLGTNSETNQSGSKRKEDTGDCGDEKPMTCHLCRKVRKNKEAFVRHLESRLHHQKFGNMLLYAPMLK